MSEEIRSVLKDLRRLEGYAEHPTNKSLLSDQIRDYEAKLAKAIGHAGVNYATVESFSWDQDRDKIRIYIFIEGIEQEKVVAVFSQTSVRIKFDDANGKKYQWAIPKLNNEIVPEKCKAVVKPRKLVIVLCKASSGTWPDIYCHENKFKPSVVNDDDPVSGVVNLVKNMYQGGGDDMKQALEKAWLETKS